MVSYYPAGDKSFVWYERGYTECMSGVAKIIECGGDIQLITKWLSDNDCVVRVPVVHSGKMPDVGWNND